MEDLHRQERMRAIDSCTAGFLGMYLTLQAGGFLAISGVQIGLEALERVTGLSSKKTYVASVISKHDFIDQHGNLHQRAELYSPGVFEQGSLTTIVNDEARILEGKPLRNTVLDKLKEGQKYAIEVETALGSNTILSAVPVK